MLLLDLFILRHGESAKRLGRNNGLRSLTFAGHREVEEIATSFKELEIKFDFIVTSPIKGAHQTALIVAKILNQEKKIQDWNELRPEGNRQELYQKLSQLRQQSSLLLVGHGPYLIGMIYDILFGGKSGQIVLKKTGLARIAITTYVPRLKGELKWLLTPTLIKDMRR